MRHGTEIGNVNPPPGMSVYQMVEAIRLISEWAEEEGDEEELVRKLFKLFVPSGVVVFGQSNGQIPID